MGTDMGYLQTKIRELQDKNEELEKKINDSLDREKRFNENVSNLIRQAKQKELYSVEELVLNAIEETYNKRFKAIFEKHKDGMSQDIILNAKGFNHSVDCIMMEIALLKKDSNFMINLMVTKLGITQEEFQKWCRKFDETYQSKQVEQDLKKFRMKFYTQRDKVREIIGEQKLSQKTDSEVKYD